MTVQLVAIDFGTTFSGYAFSVTEPGSKLTDVEILVNQVWISDRSEVTSLKTTTSLLITKEKDIIAFGYDAEEQYADLIMDEMEDHYYFFHRFKMELYDNEVNTCVVLDVKYLIGSPEIHNCFHLYKFIELDLLGKQLFFF